jgi:hypothetical protein
MLTSFLFHNPVFYNICIQHFNPSGRTMTPGYSQPLTEMSISDVFWRYGRPVLRATKLTTFMCRLSGKCGSLNLLKPPGRVQVFIAYPTSGYFLLIIRRHIDRDTDWTTEESWVGSRQKKGIFLFPKHPAHLWGLSSLSFSRYRG